MRTILSVLAVVLLSCLAWLSLAPVPIVPQAWQAPPAPGYVGVHAGNTALAALQHIALPGASGPEHVARAKDGMLYIAVDGGRLLRLDPGSGVVTQFAAGGGRILGFDFDDKGQIIAADAMRGLIAIGSDGKSVLLTDKVDGLSGSAAQIRYANSVVVARSGKIYFSDSSTRFGAREFGGTFAASILDILEHSSSGRVLEYDTVSKKTRVVLQDLCFANGLALSQDEKSLFVAETGEYRVWKIDPTLASFSAREAARQAAASGGNPRARILLSNLPGYPDNLMRGLDGKIWLGLAKPRAAAIDKMADKPWLRSVTLRLPRALWPVPKAYGHVFAFDEEGKVVRDLQDPAGTYPETTGVLETEDRLYIQSLHAHSLGWLPNK